MKKLLVTFLASVACAVTVSGGLVKLTSGSLESLRPEKQINLEYVYDGMTVRAKDKKEYREEDFLAIKVAEYNQGKPGHGDRWREGWFGDRAEAYQPQFQESLNKSLASKHQGLQFGLFKEAPYTLILKTTYTEIGWKFSDIIKHPFYINAEASLVETQNRTHVLAVFTLNKVSGNGSGTDFATRQGLAEAYAKAGKELGVFIAKTMK